MRVKGFKFKERMLVRFLFPCSYRKAERGSEEEGWNAGLIARTAWVERVTVDFLGWGQLFGELKWRGGGVYVVLELLAEVYFSMSFRLSPQSCSSKTRSCHS